MDDILKDARTMRDQFLFAHDQACKFLELYREWAPDMTQERMETALLQSFEMMIDCYALAGHCARDIIDKIERETEKISPV